jgi:hypothetical protein
MAAVVGVPTHPALPAVPLLRHRKSSVDAGHCLQAIAAAPRKQVHGTQSDVGQSRRPAGHVQPRARPRPRRVDQSRAPVAATPRRVGHPRPGGSRRGRVHICAGAAPLRRRCDPYGRPGRHGSRSRQPSARPARRTPSWNGSSASSACCRTSTRRAGLPRLPGVKPCRTGHRPTASCRLCGTHRDGAGADIGCAGGMDMVA